MGIDHEFERDHIWNGREYLQVVTITMFFGGTWEMKDVQLFDDDGKEVPLDEFQKTQLKGDTSLKQYVEDEIQAATEREYERRLES